MNAYMSVELILEGTNHLIETISSGNPIKGNLRTNKVQFEIRKQRLMKEYPEKWIAVYGGFPVLAGNSLVEVAKEFYRQYGNKPVYIGLASEKQPIEHINFSA